MTSVPDSPVVVAPGAPGPTGAAVTGTVTGTVPYPWPFDGLRDATRLALVVCGAQASLAAASPTAPAVLERLGILADEVREAGGSVVWVRHGRRDHGRRAHVRRSALPIRDTPDWQPCAAPAPGDVVIDAAGWDGCFASDLDHALRAAAVTHVVLGGLASELTVDSTVRTLNDRGHECLVVTDACAPVDADLGAHAHHSLTMSGGIFGALGTTAALTERLRATHATPSTPTLP